MGSGPPGPCGRVPGGKGRGHDAGIPYTGTGVGSPRISHRSPEGIAATALTVGGPRRTDVGRGGSTAELGTQRTANPGIPEGVAPAEAGDGPPEPGEFHFDGQDGGAHGHLDRGSHIVGPVLRLSVDADEHGLVRRAGQELLAGERREKGGGMPGNLKGARQGHDLPAPEDTENPRRPVEVDHAHHDEPAHLGEKGLGVDLAQISVEKEHVGPRSEVGTQRADDRGTDPVVSLAGTTEAHDGNAFALS